MELRLLQYVIQIAAERNFSRAAEKLHIAQPSLSQQLSKLEKELGILLFKRSTNSVELTYAGSIFVEKAKQIVDMTEQLRQEMEDIADLRKGRIIVGSLPITGAHVLPDVLTAFRLTHPNIEIALVEETTIQLEQLTASGGTDVSLLSLPVIEPSLTYEPIIEEELYLAVPPDHPLALSGSKEPIDLADMKDEPFVLLKRGQGFRAIAYDLCQQAGFAPRVVFESSNIETVQSLVAAGMGIGFVPHMVARSGLGSSHTPVYIRMKNRPTRTLVIAYRKGRYLSNAAEAFIDIFRKTMQALNKQPPDKSKD
ncbi:LysR family transcriptional regulator [Cohnella thailandensis]|uniref:LysR family transcriptional regulator n=1 Tax=Cohnella thailandensis TaxID=557557 RepID=A0A841T4I0_9BACL|nr:LysR family transcriptional regulator [Cohnella thailandensis]MBB6636767.1 LysR family transcriptional regulator [Cohnella thailandensis]MBP1973357.1 DNA-binding transcriptional LysR family regulator [Cohnella thailandensis]